MEAGHQDRERDLAEVIYFAIIRPDKGLEQVIALAALIKNRNLAFRIRVIGRPHPKYPDYFHRMYELSKDLPILWDIGLPDNAVRDLFSRSQAGYLPFPDGASERRSSLFALLVNGVVTVTTKGAHTPPEMDKAVGYADTPQEALQLIQRIIAEKEYQEQLRQGAYSFINNYTWESIAEKHIEIYRMILNNNKVMKDNA
jgi:glycosyltransferase involved in cell wall biosynthesis